MSTGSPRTCVSLAVVAAAILTGSAGFWAHAPTAEALGETTSAELTAGDGASRSLGAPREDRSTTWTTTARVRRGTVVVRASFSSACPSATMRLKQRGALIGTATGPSSLAEAVRVRRGTLSVAVTSTCRTPRSVTVNEIVRAPSPRAETGRVSVLRFGAVGDGVKDDGAALQRALDSLKPGQTLVLPAGRVFAHSDILTVKVPGVKITGGGTLLATREARSEFFVAADSVTVDRVKFKIASTTRRWQAYEQMRVRVGPYSRVVLRDLLIDGSAACGVYVGGASNFILERLTVENTRADGIHITGGAHHGVVQAPTIRNSGDDGVAVVSYVADTRPVHDIVVSSPRLLGQTHGRAFSVVGGEDIIYSTVYAERSSSAAIYIAAEASYRTFGAKRILVDGGILKHSNQDSTVDHGAIYVHNGQAGYLNTDITVRDVRVVDTRSTSPFQVAVVSNHDAVQRRIVLRNIAIEGPPARLFWSNAGLVRTFNRAGWTYRPTAQARRRIVDFLPR